MVAQVTDTQAETTISTDLERSQRLTAAIVLASSVALALAVRAWALSARVMVDFDETYYYILGRNLVTGLGYTLNGLPHTAFPPLYPLLVGLTSLALPDIHAAASAVSALSGALLPVPVYFLAKEVHGRRAAAFAAFAAAVWPALFFYAAVNVAYPNQMYFGSEPLYVTLIASGVLFMYLFARRGGWLNAALAGASFGLASLVRNEGPVVFAFVFLWLVAVLAASRRLWKGKTLPQTALVAAAMLAVFSPFLIYVHGVTGQWTLGAKLANNARIRDTLWDWVTKNDNEAFLKAHYSLNADATQMEDPYWGMSDWHRANMREQGSISSGVKLVGDPDWRWLKVFAYSFHGGFVPVAHWLAWAFIIAGLCFGPWNRDRFAWWGLIGASVAAMAMLAVSLYVLPRHELPLVALMAVAFGKGADGAGRLIGRGAARLMGREGAFSLLAASTPAAVACIILLNRGIDLNRAVNMVEGTPTAGEYYYYWLALAEDLKPRIPAGSTLMCNEPWLALWAGLEWRVAPVAPPDRIVTYARERGVDFALLRAWHLTSREETQALELFYAGKIDYGDSDTWFLFDFRSGRGDTPGGGT